MLIIVLTKALKPPIPAITQSMIVKDITGINPTPPITFITIKLQTVVKPKIVEINFIIESDFPHEFLTRSYLCFNSSNLFNFF